jgi:hypothetical protein
MLLAYSLASLLAAGLMVAVTRMSGRRCTSVWAYRAATLDLGLASAHYMVIIWAAVAGLVPVPVVMLSGVSVPLLIGAAMAARDTGRNWAEVGR